MVDLAAIAKVQKKMAARKSQAIGDQAQNLVRNVLIAHGFRHVVRIETGWRKIGGKWMPGAKVAGDFRAVATGGQSVLIEVKYRPDVLHWSQIADHQVRALDEHANAGGLSVLAWVSQHGVAMLSWTTLRMVERFDKGHAITPEIAARCAVQL